MKTEFKVGQEVMVFYRGNIEGRDTIKSISAKRGDIKLEKSNINFSNDGSSKSGGFQYDYHRIKPVTLELELELQARIARSHLKKMNEYQADMTDEQVRELWKTLKPILKKYQEERKER